MAITRTPMVDDDGTGTTGTVINNAWKQQLYDQIDQAFGLWVPVPYSAADFTTEAGANWIVEAGDVTTLRYTIIGKTLFLAFRIFPTSVTVAASELRMQVPGGNVLASTIITTIRAIDPGGEAAGFASATAGAAYLIFKRFNASWGISTNGTGVFGEIFLEIV